MARVALFATSQISYSTLFFISINDKAAGPCMAISRRAFVCAFNYYSSKMRLTVLLLRAALAFWRLHASNHHNGCSPNSKWSASLVWIGQPEFNGVLDESVIKAWYELELR